MIGAVKHVVFIVGCQRSGTTLTGQIIGAHDNAVLIDEFEGLYPWFQAMAKNEPDADRLTSDVLKKSVSKYAYPADRFVQENGEVSLAANVEVLVLKAPNLTYSFEAISKLDVKTHVIYPIRDPRAVVASMERLSHIHFVDNQIKRMRQSPGIEAMFEDEFHILDNITHPHHVRAAIIWRIKSGLGDEFKKRGLQIFQFLYEDLVENPGLWIPKILKFCELSPGDAPLNHQMIYQGFGPGDTDRKRAIDNGGIASWMTSLGEAAAKDILQTSQPLAGEFGYA